MNPAASKSPPSRLLVTGAAGFIGSNLVRWLLAHRPGAQIVSVDALSYAGNRANLADVERDPRHRFVQADINDRAPMARLLDEGIEAVINAAAHTHVDRSLLGADEFVRSNVAGVQILLDLIKDRPHIRLLQISTDEVYGSQRAGEFADESSPLSPRNPYSATKAAADLLVLAYGHSFNMDVVITRCCNNFGPYQYPEKVIPLFVTNLMDGQPVPLYGDGQNYREWIYVDDHCAAIVRVLDGGRGGEVYNITSGKGLANVELTQLILEAVGKDASHIRHVADRPGHDRRYALDGSKIARELEWRAQHSFVDCLAATVRWYQESESWWRPIKSGEYRRYFEQQYAERMAAAR